ncbi:MAG: phosphate ABC transporter substrate-binding protein PstS [Dehalococcoidia bacterium]|nr:phosphate ABC transporter substrate-binding protein PstS [Dehalococcoidia bacterium]
MRIFHPRFGPAGGACGLALALVGAAVLAACGGSRGPLLAEGTASVTASGSPVPAVDVSGIPPDVGSSDEAQITAAGSTFAAPLYTRWFIDYRARVAAGVRSNYQAIGSGGGIQNIIRKTIDFGATDAPMTDREVAKAPGIQHIPTAIGPVVVTYNINGISQPLKLDGPTLAGIYLGKIAKWSDPAIVAQNAGARLPDADIIVVHRSDGSGTSYTFTDYLSKVSADWAEGVGKSKNPQWPKGIGGQGNDGVTQYVRQNANSIGYVELIFADKNNLPKAQLKNASGEYITPTTQSASLAAQGVTLPPDYRVSIVNSRTSGAYPISTFTWILLYREQSDASKGKALVDILWWAIHDGQRTSQELDYAALPADVVRAVEQTLATQITYDGRPLLRAGR